jgi:radical SAM protein
MQSLTAATTSLRHPTDFAHAPFLVIWEVTRACALACVHCRADAIARRDPRELSTAEAFALIDQVCDFGKPHPLFVLTGGDPMWRKDLREIVRYAANAGLSVALTPSGTAAATRKRLEELRDAGLGRVAVSLDGPDPDTHDAFRRVRGSFANTMKIIDAVVDLGLPLQINTTVSRRTLPTLERMAERVATFPLTLWAAFFLVQTGRGASLDQISPAECETVLRWLWQLARTVPFGIKTTEAPHYRRVAWQAMYEGDCADAPAHDVSLGPQDVGPRHSNAVNDGNGFVFIDHVGNICPSGFLPLTRGKVCDGSLVRVYRDDPVFCRLREPDALEGKCGRCRFRARCGGSRSRAFAQTGNAFASDPLCAYEPGPEVEQTIE